MRNDPEKDRGATDAGRSIGPHRRNRVNPGSVPYPSPPERKNPSENATRAVVGCERRMVSSGAACVCALDEPGERDLDWPDLDLRKPGTARSAAGPELGGGPGRGGNGRRQLAARRDGRGGHLLRWRSRSRRPRSVTCTLRRFPTPARHFTDRTEANAPESGVSR